MGPLLARLHSFVLHTATASVCDLEANPGSGPEGMPLELSCARNAQDPHPDRSRSTFLKQLECPAMLKQDVEVWIARDDGLTDVPELPIACNRF